MVRASFPATPAVCHNFLWMVDRQPGNLGVLAGQADSFPIEEHAFSRTVQHEEFVGGAQVDWLAASTSIALLLIILALSLDRILGLDQKLLAAVRSARAKRLARQNQAIEAARKSLESQFSKDE